MNVPQEAKTKKILIADDVASMRNMTKAILRDAGFTNLYDAADGNLALKEIKKQQVHLIICDWNMPQMTGIELLKTVREDAELKDVTFLMVTSATDVKYVKEAIAAGVTDYIVKPYQPDVLLNKIVTNL